MGKADDAIFAGGQDYDRGSHLNCNHSQVYDGTSWSFGPNINNERRTDSAGSRFSGLLLLVLLIKLGWWW